MARYYLKTLIAFASWALLVCGAAYLVNPRMFAELPFGPRGFWVFLGVSWLVFTTSHVLFTRWVKGPERWRVRQRSELVVAMPVTEALEQCTAAVKQLPHFRRVRSLAGETIALTRMTWWSFGERIRCTAIPMDEQHTHVVVSSRPAIPITIVDYGRNWANVVQIRRALAPQVSG